MSDYTDGVAEYVALGESMAAAEAHARSVMRTKKFDTIAVHGVYNMQAAAANQGSIVEPGFFSSAQHFENCDREAFEQSYRRSFPAVPRRSCLIP